MWDAYRFFLNELPKVVRGTRFTQKNFGAVLRHYGLMHTIGAGVNQIRIHVLGEWRVIYVAKLHHAVYVLHAFHKKTRKTSRRDIDLARQRYRQIGGNL